MNIFCFSYTKSGAGIAAKITDYFSRKETAACFGYTKEKYLAFGALESLDALPLDFLKNIFKKNNALIFIGAAGIAVRKIAPFVHSKETDPAVIVIDEQGRFVIPLLAGHIGGANELAGELASLLGAATVITTATDLQGKFAVDTWAAKAGLAIINAAAIKNISAAILDGIEVGLKSDFPVEGDLPPGVVTGEEPSCGICITVRQGNRPFANTLTLAPKCVVAGMGCRKNASPDTVETLFLNTLKECGILLKSLTALATIDLKKDEPALKILAEKYNLHFITYTAAELNDTAGDFTASEFVRKIAGTDNVCERAAVKAAGNSNLICRKKSLSGVTIALAQKNYTVRWRPS